MNKQQESTDTLWRETASTPSETKKLTKYSQCDVCIIGAGISGLTLAYQLLKAGKSVIIVDSRSPGLNETGNTSAHLSNALDDRFYNIEKMHGKEKAKLAATSHGEAIDFIESVCKSEKIDCDFKRVEGILFMDDNNLQKELAAAKRCGLIAKLEKKPKLGNCLVFANQAQFHPVKYLYGLMKSVQELGAQLYFDSAVTEVHDKEMEVIVNSIHKIKASKIVGCTNSQFYSSLSMHFKLNPQRSYVVGVAIPKNSVTPALYWDNEDPYHYVRVTNKSSEEDILIIGGEDHRVGASVDCKSYDKLLEWGKKYFPLNSSKIEFQWSGQILEPIDYLAYIGKNPKNADLYMLTGDSGNGLTHGTLGGMLIADLILGKTNPYIDLYQLKRFKFRSLKNCLMNMASSMKAYLAYLFPHSSQLPKNGEGKIVRYGFKKMAVYRDDAGHLHRCTAVCSHLKALLKWNPIEKSWDCAAHGSRFDTKGNILNGPAMQALQCFK